MSQHFVSDSQSMVKSPWLIAAEKEMYTLHQLPIPVPQPLPTWKVLPYV